MLQLSTSSNESPFQNMQSHLDEILRRGGERSETLLVLSLGIHQYSGTKLPIEFVQMLFALVSLFRAREALTETNMVRSSPTH